MNRFAAIEFYFSDCQKNHKKFLIY